jgi:poly(3-hydroxybutyrate) depolymerase
MGRWLLFLLILGLLAAGPAVGAEPEKHSFSYADRDRTYYFLAADGTGPAPLLVLLHGSGGNGLFMLEQWKEVATRENIALLAPDSLHTQIGWDLHKDGPDLIHEAIQTVAATHPVDFHRLYVFGQSGGAVYALNLAMLESEYFAAAAFHAGGWRKPEEYRFSDYARRKIPIAMYVGDRDEFFPVDSVQATEHILAQRGFPAELHLLPGRVHSYLDVPPDFHATVWQFLGGHALEGVPNYTAYRWSGRG